MPIVLLPAAAPEFDATVEAVAAATVQPAYVYLSRVVEAVLGVLPKAKMPTVLLPAAEPFLEFVEAAPPALTTSPE
jgi:hypothetical protein